MFHTSPQSWPISYLWRECNVIFQTTKTKPDSWKILWEKGDVGFLMNLQEGLRSRERGHGIGVTEPVADGQAE